MHFRKMSPDDGTWWFFSRPRCKDQAVHVWSRVQEDVLPVSACNCFCGNFWPPRRWGDDVACLRIFCLLVSLILLVALQMMLRNQSLAIGFWLGIRLLFPELWLALARLTQKRPRTFWSTLTVSAAPLHVWRVFVCGSWRQKLFT